MCRRWCLLACSLRSFPFSLFAWFWGSGLLLSRYVCAPLLPNESHQSIKIKSGSAVPPPLSLSRPPLFCFVLCGASVPLLLCTLWLFGLLPCCVCPSFWVQRPDDPSLNFPFLSSLFPSKPSINISPPLNTPFQRGLARESTPSGPAFVCVLCTCRCKRKSRASIVHPSAPHIDRPADPQLMTYTYTSMAQNTDRAIERSTHY